MSTASVVAFGVGLVGVLLPAGWMWLLRTLRIRRRVEAESLAQGRILRVDDSASFRGTSGTSGVSGNGCLVATDRELVFVKWLPHGVVRIPRSVVQRVDRTQTHLGRTSMEPMLRITWVDTLGEPHKTCWAVRDSDEWMRALAPTRGSSTRSEAIASEAASVSP